MTTLPEDILRLIFSCFQFSVEVDDNEWNGRCEIFCPLPGTPTPPQLSATLNSISQASKQFYALANPLLYHTLYLEDDSDLALLLRTLSQSPHLGRLVVELNLLLTPDIFWLRRGFLSWLLDARSNLNLPEDLEDGMYRGLFSEDPDEFHDALEAFLLASTPNLRVLGLGLPCAPMVLSALLQHAVDRVEGEESPLSCLQEVRLVPGHLLGQIGRLKGLFGLPSLRVLRGASILWSQDPNFQPFRVPIAKIGLQHIHLESVTITVGSLESLLSGCVNLKTLRICRLVHRGNKFDCDAMGDVLRAHGTKLESLDIKFMVDPFESDEDMPYDSDEDGLENLAFGRLGCLQRMLNLKHLRITLHNLIGLDDYMRYEPTLPPPLKLDEVLPASLESIYIYSAMLRTNTFKDEVLRMTRCKRLSNLRHVDLPPVFKHFGRLGRDDLDLSEWINASGDDRTTLFRREHVLELAKR